MLLPAMVNTLVIVEAVQGAEHLVAEITDGVVEGLQVLLLLVALQCQLGAQQFAAHVAPVARGQWQGQGQACIAATGHIMYRRRVGGAAVVVEVLVMD